MAFRAILNGLGLLLYIFLVFRQGFRGYGCWGSRDLRFRPEPTTDIWELPEIRDNFWLVAIMKSTENCLHWATWILRARSRVEGFGALRLLGGSLYLTYFVTVVITQL